MWLLLLTSFLNADFEQIKIGDIGTKSKCEEIAGEYIKSMEKKGVEVVYLCIEKESVVSLPSASAFN